MNKLLLVILLLAAPISLTSGSPGFWDEARLAPVRNGIARQDPDYLPAYEVLKKFCDAELGRSPYSVMQKQYTPPSRDKHDYVSMARYLDRPQEEFPYEQIKDWDSVQGGLAWILLRATRFDPNTNYREAFFRHYPTPGSDLGYLLHAPELR